MGRASPTDKAGNREPDEASAEQYLGKAWPRLRQVADRLVAMARRRRLVEVAHQHTHSLELPLKGDNRSAHMAELLRYNATAKMESLDVAG